MKTYNSEEDYFKTKLSAFKYNHDGRSIAKLKFRRKYYRSIFNQCKTCLCLTQIKENGEYVKHIQSKIENNKIQDIVNSLKRKWQK